MTAANFFQMLVSGLAMGAIYTLTALGLFITHLATSRLNFGQGEFLMVGAFISMAMLLAGVSAFLVIPAVIVIMGVLGWALERFTIRPLDRFGSRGGGAYSWVLTTAGAALILQNVVEFIWGNSTQYSPPVFTKSRQNVVEVFGIGFFIEEIIIVLVAFLVIALFCWFLFFSKWGKAVYAVAFNRDVASLLGMNVARITALVFILASMLAGISGVLVGPLVSVHPHMGLIFTIKALAVAAIGGFSNPVGILIGGVMFGVAEVFSNYWDSAFGDLYPLIFVLAFLVWRPSGLFGEFKADVR